MPKTQTQTQTQKEWLTRFQLQPPAMLTPKAPMPQRQGRITPAAVLIPLVKRDTGLTVLLTKRSAHLRHHAGQICFPGGRQDPADDGVIATALRETQEEMGIGPDLIHVYGTLKPLCTISGFQVHPVLGLVDSNYSLNLNRDEVADAFEVPLDHLMDLRHHIPLTVLREGKPHTLYWIFWRRRAIWGTTARIIVQLAHQLAHE
ncbi:MAG: CoA pyrophosphatase [Aeromonas sp.]